MRNKIKTWYQSCQHPFFYWCVAILFAWLLLLACSSDKNAAIVDFLCMDQSGAPLEKVEVSLGGKMQKSDDQGNCRFQLALDQANLWLLVNASKPGYQFIGPDSVYLTKGESLTYAVNFWHEAKSESIDNTAGSDKLTLEFVFPDALPPPEPSLPPQDTSDKPAPKYSLTVNSIPELSEITIYEQRMHRRNVKISERIISNANKRRAPFTILLPKSKYRINSKPAEFNYYKPMDEHVNLASNKEIMLKHPIWPVVLVISNAPDGAEILVNSKSTPGKEISLKEERIYTIEIKKAGFRTKKYDVDFHPAANKGVIVNSTKLEIPYTRKITIDAALQKL